MTLLGLSEKHIDPGDRLLSLGTAELLPGLGWNPARKEGHHQPQPTPRDPARGTEGVPNRVRDSMLPCHEPW